MNLNDEMPNFDYSHEAELKLKIGPTGQIFEDDPVIMEKIKTTPKDLKLIILPFNKIKIIQKWLSRKKYDKFCLNQIKWEWPMVCIKYQGEYYLLDGNHRLAAFKYNNYTEAEFLVEEL